MPVDYWYLPYTGQGIQDALTNASPRVGASGNWEVYKAATGTWEDTGTPASPKNAYIGQNGHWYVWDDNNGAYMDSGVIAGYTAYTGSVEVVT